MLRKSLLCAALLPLAAACSDAIRLIVSEIELERAEGACVGEDDDDCEEFEGGPFLVNLLDGTGDEVVNAIIPAGSYTEFEFEVENLAALNGRTVEFEAEFKSGIRVDKDDD
jgi:hypothetical protein